MARRASHEPHVVLGVSRGASRDQVTQAFRAQARSLHPDVSGSDTTAAMAALSAARDQLLHHAPPDETVMRRPAEAPERPAWAKEHDAAWTDHWAAWNEPRRPDDA